MRTSYDADTLCLQDILVSENPQLRTDSDRGGFLAARAESTGELRDRLAAKPYTSSGIRVFAAVTEFFPGRTSQVRDRDGQLSDRLRLGEAACPAPCPCPHPTALDVHPTGTANPKTAKAELAPSLHKWGESDNKDN